MLCDAAPELDFLGPVTFVVALEEVENRNESSRHDDSCNGRYLQNLVGHQQPQAI